MKVLLIDVETAPHLGYIWKLWDENISLDQLVSAGYMLCWSAKWLGDDTIHYASKHENSTEYMLGHLHGLLNEADAVVHYNGKKFDIPHINREFLLNGYSPPAPYKQIDLLETVKLKFKFASNKLDYVAKSLGLGEKVKHDGFKLWVGCIEGKKEAWSKMLEYNIQDVLLLEKVYYTLRPWIKGHANYSMLETDKLVCPHCGSEHHQKRGFTHTLASTYQRYQCKDCGTWFKDNKRVNTRAYKTTEISL